MCVQFHTTNKLHFVSFLFWQKDFHKKFMYIYIFFIFVHIFVCVLLCTTALYACFTYIIQTPGQYLIV